MNTFWLAMMLMAGALLPQPIWAQWSEVPQKIQEAFQQKYPKAQDVGWEELEDAYLASFILGENYCDATFDKKGNWLESSTILDETALPGVVAAGVRAKHPDFQYFTSVVRTECPDGLLYYLSFEKGESYYTLTVDPQGKILDEQVEDFDGED